MKRLLGGAVMAMAMMGQQCPPGQKDGGAPGEPAWQVVAEGTAVGGAVLSVWGASAQDVFLVGGSLGNGGESVVWHHDGTALQRLHPGGTETYWWVSGWDGTHVYMVGEHGRVTTYNGQSFQDLPRPLDVTLWGVQAFAADDVWVVGGSPGRHTSQPNDIVRHYNGTDWVEETLPGTPLGASLFKVWGTSAQDLYVVGEYGTLWHRSATGWVLQSADYSPALAQGTLFTVHGCDTGNVWAVGGNALLHQTGGVWAPHPEATVRGANGINCSAGAVTVVGFGGLKLRITDTGVQDATFDQPFGDMHAAWTDEGGNVWVVGGDWLSPARPGVDREGLLARFSAQPPPALQ